VYCAGKRENIHTRIRKRVSKNEVAMEKKLVEINE